MSTLARWLYWPEIERLEDRCLLTAAIIDNDVIQLGVNATGELNVEGPPSAGGTVAVGLRYLPTNNEATAPGCLCEGWGAADAATGVAGYANKSTDGVVNLTEVSFTATESTAVSVVDIQNDRTPFLRVSHDYHPSPATPFLYEVAVTFENLGNSAIQDLRYRRVMDWDIEPTPFNEFVTLQGLGVSPAVLFVSNDGFTTANPLGGASDLGTIGNIIDAGPNDHGALFDFGLGQLEPGATNTIRIFYGAAGTEAEALAALAAVGAKVYSLGQSSAEGGETTGSPNTFVFGFSSLHVGGENSPPIAEAGNDQTVVEGDVALFDGTASSDPDIDTLTFSWDLGDGNAATGATPTHVYADDGEYLVTLTVTDPFGGTDSDTLTVTVESARPLVQIDGDEFIIEEGSTFVASGTVGNAGADVVTATVDYDDGSGPLPLTLVEGAFGLDHLYADEGTFNVTVAVTDDDGETGVASAVVIAILNADAVGDSTITVIQPGGTGPVFVQTGQDTNSDGEVDDPLLTMTITLAPGATEPTTVFLAGYNENPVDPAGSDVIIFRIGTDDGPAVVTADAKAFYDIRVTNGQGATAVVTFDYPDDVSEAPILTYFDPADNQWKQVLGSTVILNSYVVDPAAHTITVIFDDTSSPAVGALGGTVFTVSVATQISVTATVRPSVAVAFAGNSSALVNGLARKTTFTSSTQLTLALTASQDSRLSARVGANISLSAEPTRSGDGEAEILTEEEFLFWLWELGDEVMIEEWLKLKAKGSKPAEPPTPKPMNLKPETKTTPPVSPKAAPTAETKPMPPANSPVIPVSNENPPPPNSSPAVPTPPASPEEHAIRQQILETVFGNLDPADSEGAAEPDAAGSDALHLLWALGLVPLAGLGWWYSHNWRIKRRSNQPSHVC